MKKFFSFVAAVLFAGSMMAADLLTIDFTQGQGNWTIDNVTLPEGTEFIWAQSAQYGMKATAYFESANHASESWLVSPAVDLTAVDSATLKFSHARRYGDLSQLSVKASSDGQNWVDLAVSAWPDGSNWNYIDATADLAAYSGMNVKVAFVYTSSATAAATWEVKTVAISEGGTPAPPVEDADVVFTSTEFNGKGTSGSGSEVTATKNGVTFTCNKAYGDQYGVRCYKNSNVTITSTEQPIGKIVFEFATVSGTYYNGGLNDEIVVNAMSWSAEGLSSQARMNKVSIYFGEYDTIVPPVVSLDTITVAEALEIGQALEDGAMTEKQYVIAGYSSSIETKFDAQYGNETFWMADSETSEAASNADSAFYVYRGTVTPAEEMGLHAKIYVTSVIMKYMKSGVAVIETNGKVNVNVVEKGVIEAPDTITVAKALEIGGQLAAGTVSAKEYVIKGYVSSIQEYFSEQYKNETFWITDTKGERTSDKTKAFEVYRGKPNTGAEIGMEAYIQIQCKIKNYNGTIENDGMNLTFEVLEQGLPVVVDTVTVAEAMEIGNALADNAYTDNPYVVIGYVTKAYEPAEGKTTQNFYMADDPNDRGEFYAYNASPDSTIHDGDYVQLFGKIQKYVGSKTTIELSYGTATHIEAPVPPVLDPITVAEALDIAKALTPDPKKAVSTDEKYAVKGYVTKIKSADDKTYYMADEMGVYAEFMAYKCSSIDSEVAEGDLVIVTGKIMSYNGETYYNYEISGGTLVHAEPQGIESVTLTEKVQKIMMNGAMYIIRNGKMYNVQGAQVR
jgi:hypothetical protein